MPHYRAHILDEHGHLIGAADFDCADDVEAKERARQLDGHRVVFWRQACGPGICAPSRFRDAGEYVTALPKADPKTARAGARRRCSIEIRCPG